jgi:3-hydroxyisobutyrate dehydrogenase
MKIAFIGLGNMGNPMARNLMKAGHEVAAFDVVRAAMEKLGGEGARTAGSIREAITNAQTVITMLPSSPHVHEVYLGAEGILAAVKPGVLLIDSSTIDPHTARIVADAALKHRNPMLDAPVSGGTGGAEAATLTFMVGGDAKDFAVAQPILAKMGKNIVHCGGAGNGQVAKICNNLLLGISMLGVSEAMTLGTKLGMDPATLAGVINTSSGRCWSSDTYNPFPGVLPNAPAARGYTGGFGVDLMLKDLSLAVDAARQSKQPVMLGALAQQLYQQWSAGGEGGKDFSSIINLYKKN